MSFQISHALWQTYSCSSNHTQVYEIYTIMSTLFISPKQYPATSQLDWLALTDFFYLKSLLFFLLKNSTQEVAVLPLSTTIFKSNEKKESGQN